MTIAVRALASTFASLGLALTACGGSTPAKRGEEGTKAASSAKSTSADATTQEGLGLEDDQLWRLSLEGEAAPLGEWGGKIVRVKRKEFDFSVSFEGEGSSMSFTFVEVPMGQTGRFPATPARFEASGQSVECSTAMGGAVWVKLTHNEKDRVAGRIEGDAGCKPDDSKARWSGAFDYSGAIEFK